MGLRFSAVGLAVLISASHSMAAPEPEDLLPGTVATVKPATLAKFVAKPVTSSLFDLPDSSNDPVSNGATLRLFDTVLRPDGDFTFALPAGAGWKLIGSPGDVKGYKYKGTGEAGDPCKVLLTTKVLKAVCKGGDVAFTLPFEGNLGVILTVGSGAKDYCAEFGGTSKGDETKVFKRVGAPAPELCPSDALPTTTTTGPSTTSTEAPTTTTEPPTTTTEAPATTTTLPITYYTVAVTSPTPASYPASPPRPGGGSISSTPAGIDGCSAGSTCSAPFAESSNVVLTATPDSTSSFTSWTNCPSPSGNVCTLPNLSGDTTVTANFTRVYRTLSAVIAAAGTGQGSVSGSSVVGTTPINCSYFDSSVSSCSEQYVIDSTVTLTATPRDANSVFAGWGSGCSSASGNTCNVTVDSNKTITATFDINCSNEGGGATCSTATNLGTISPGSPVTASGNTVQFGDSDWYVASFGEVCGDGTPRVQITNDPSGTFRFDLYTSCGGGTLPYTCSTGSTSQLTSYQYSCPMCAPAPWPSTVVIRVYRSGENKPSCTPYTLTVSR